jgi:Family of unknown function (DUF6502)
VSQSLKAAVTRAVLRLLDPLARLLLDAGIGIGEFHELAKRAYVRAALEVTRKEKPNLSQIGVLTGIARREVATLLENTDTGPPNVERGTQRAERVLRGWWNDPEFRDPSGRPAILPLRGRRTSFTSLVNRYAGDPRVRTLLQELLRVKAVRRLPDKRLEVLSPTFATARWDGSGIEIVGERVRDLLTTLVHNLRHPSRPRYVRFVVNAQVDPRFVPLLVRDLTEQAEVLADSFEDALNDPERLVRPARSAQDAHRLGVCIFVVEEPTLVVPIAETQVVTARRGRQPG